MGQLFTSLLAQRRTSHDWYCALPVSEQTIYDPDGWRDLEDPARYWHRELIMEKEFRERYDRCSMLGGSRGGMPYGNSLEEYVHNQPKVGDVITFRRERDML